MMQQKENTIPEEMQERLLSQLLNRNKEETLLAEKDIEDVCKAAIEILREEPIILQLGAPIKICGDLHGQYEDLIRIFELGLYPPKSNYLFLGNYVGRGKMSIETVCTLLLLKIKYPQNIFLLRGNHQCTRINRFYGFYDECKKKYSIQLWKQINDCFDYLPICAVIENKIFCIHGGLSPELKSLKQIYEITRPVQVSDTGLLCDLLWSDPNRTAPGWTPNERGVSLKFGSDVLEQFLEANQFDLMVRGHQLVQDGFEFFGDQSLVTVFSAPNYAGEFENAGAFMMVDESLKCTFQLMQPKGMRRIY